jgi:hypothetical protein
MKRTSLILAAVALLLGCASQTWASPILTIDDANGNIGNVDVATGNVTSFFANNTGTTLTDIGYSPSGVLYGINFTNLYKITLSAGLATATNVGSLGLSGANALVFGSNGTLYAAANNTTDLYTVNTNTGAATNIGNVGAESAGDLAFVGSTLYESSTTGDLIAITLSGGTVSSATDVGNMGFGTDVFGLAEGGNGVLYDGSNSFDLVGANGTSFITEAVAAPEPASLALLGIGAVCSLGYGWRRRLRAG